MPITVMRAWDAGKNRVNYVYKDEIGKVKIGEQRVRWFFYVKNIDFDSHKGIFNYFKGDGIVNEYEREEVYTKVYVDRIHNGELFDKNNEYVWEYRDKKLNYLLKVLDEKDIHHYEADLRVFQRWIVSSDVVIEPNYRVCYFDIETNDSNITGKPIPGEFQILSFSIVDEETGKYAFVKADDLSEEAEKELLIKMLKLFNNYDVICSWNGCFVKDTPISLLNGKITNVQDVKVGDLLLGFDNKSKTVPSYVKHVFKHKKYKTIYEIETESGKIIRASEEHPFLTTYSEVFKYIKAPQLRPGDYLCQPITRNIDKEYNDFNINDYKFAGLMMTDGHIRNINNGMMSFSNTNKKIYNFIERYLKSKNIDYKKYPYQKNDKHKLVYQYNFHSESLMNMLFWMGVPSGRKTDQSIDLGNIYKQNINRIKSFLIGMWYGDGTKTTSHIQISNKNTDLQYWMIRLFNRIGYYAYKVRDSKDGKNYFDAIRTSYMSHIIPWYFVTKYWNNVKLTGLTSDIYSQKTPCTRQSFMKYCKNSELVNNMYFDKIVNIKIVKYDDYVYNFETSTHNYIANDLIVHNCHFDFPYIKARCQLHGLIYDWRKKFFQDHLERLRKLGPALPSYSLEYVAQHYLGEGKVDRNERIIDLFNNNPEKLKVYNIRDSLLMRRIELKTKFLSVARQINVIGKSFVDDIYISRKIDMLVLHQAYVDGKYHFRTKVRKEESEEDDDEKFAGAYVFDPVLGVHESVSVLDVGSLYPNIIKTFNVSPDTLITDENRSEVPEEMQIRTPNGQRFRKDFIGILAKVVELIVAGRNKYKALMKTVPPDSNEHKTYDSLQYAYKSFGLSFYGVTGNKYARFYDTRVSESITLTGQHFIKNIASFLKDKGNIVVYGDTDSSFVKIKDKDRVPELLKEIKELSGSIAKKFNCAFCSIEMAHDKRFAKMIIVAKKNYAGYLDFIDGKYLDTKAFYVAGLECKRTDKARLVVFHQKDVLMKMLSPEGIPLETAVEYIEKLKDRIINKRNITIDDIKVAQKLTKDVEEYRSNSMHLKVVEMLQESGQAVYIGDKVEYFIYSVDSAGKPVPRPVSMFDGGYARIYYWNNIIYPPLMRVLSAAFPKYPWDKFKVTKKMAKRESNMGRSDLW